MVSHPYDVPNLVLEVFQKETFISKISMQFIAAEIHDKERRTFKSVQMKKTGIF